MTRRQLFSGRNRKVFRRMVRELRLSPEVSDILADIGYEIESAWSEQLQTLRDTVLSALISAESALRARNVDKATQREIRAAIEALGGH